MGAFREGVTELKYVVYPNNCRFKNNFVWAAQICQLWQEFVGWYWALSVGGGKSNREKKSKTLGFFSQDFFQFSFSSVGPRFCQLGNFFVTDKEPFFLKKIEILFLLRVQKVFFH